MTDFLGKRIKRTIKTPPDGVPCDHPGCLSHMSHPCEGCGRIGGRKSTNKLNPCPCGETPDSLSIFDNGVKWAYVRGNCCGEWNIEFRTMYKEIDSKECMELAVEAWNRAKRG